MYKKKTLSAQAHGSVFFYFTLKLENLLKEIFNKNDHKRMSYCDNFFHCILLINKKNLFIVTCNVVIFKPLTVPLGLRREMWLKFAVSQRRKDTWAHVQSDTRQWLSWGQSKSHRLSAHLLETKVIYVIKYFLWKGITYEKHHNVYKWIGLLLAQFPFQL